MEKQSEGWLWLPTVARYHYFRNGKSLCGKHTTTMHSFMSGKLPFGMRCKTCDNMRIKEKKDV